MRFQPTGPSSGAGSGPVRIYIGEYQDGSSAVANADPTTDRAGRHRLHGRGKYQARAVGPYVGHHRFELTVRASQQRTVPVTVEQNLAASSLGATAVGDGTGAQDLLDGTESSEWSAESPRPR